MKMGGVTSEQIVVVATISGQLIGGLVGHAVWGWFSIDVLWVEEEWRSKGIGRRLLHVSEDVAVQKGCHSSHTDSFDFQAPGFYERAGYIEFGNLPDYGDGQVRRFFKKSLTIGHERDG